MLLQKVEPYAARIPYMTTPGNHETFYNFAAYRYRYQMPVDNLGPEGLPPLQCSSAAH